MRKIGKKILILLMVTIMTLGSFTSAFAVSNNRQNAEDTKQMLELLRTLKEVGPSEETNALLNQLTLTTSDINYTTSTKKSLNEEVVSERIEALIDKGLVKGDARGYRLYDSITRAEVIAMLVRVLDKENAANSMKSLPSSFKDMGSNHWANGYVNLATGLGLISGYPDGTFRPEVNISYSEVITFLVRATKDLTPAEKVNLVWPQSYIMKAIDIGLLKDVQVSSYDNMAIREKVFEMVYNAMGISEDNLVEGKPVNALVFENYRNSSLDTNSISLRLLNSQGVKNGLKEDDVMTINLSNVKMDKEGIDSEALLGKVVSISFDKNNKPIKMSVNEEYKQVVGIVEEIESDRISIGGSWYTIKTDDKTNIDRRLSTAYYNNKDLKYDGNNNFRVKILSNNIDEFVTATVKNGNILYMEAFDFADIAVVAKSANSKTIEYYDDSRDGTIGKLDATKVNYVVEFEDGDFYISSLDDIEKDDVIHWFKDNKGNITIVVFKAENASQEGKFKGISYESKSSKNVIVEIDKEEVPVLVNYKNRNAVYSETKEADYYYALTHNFDRELEAFYNEDIIALRDIYGNIQAITNASESMSVVGVITDKFLSEVEIVMQNGKSEYFEATKATKYHIEQNGKLRSGKFNDFDLGDLVKITNSGYDIVKMELLTKTSKTIDKITKDVVDFGSGEYYYLGRNNLVFIVGDETKALTINEANKLIDEKSPIKGYVIQNNRDSNVVDILVITDYTSKKSNNTVDVIAKVTNLRAEGVNYRITFEDALGEVFNHLIEDISTISKIRNNSIKRGVIVEVKTDKDSKEIVEVNVILNETAPVFYVYDAGRGKGGGGSTSYLVLEDIYGTRKTVWLVGTANVFGDYARGYFVAIGKLNTYDAISILDVRDTREVTGEWPDLNRDAVNAFLGALNKLPALKDVKAGDEASVVSVRALYDALTNTQKSLVNKDDLDKLLAYEARITELKNQPSNGDIIAVQAFLSSLNSLPELNKIKLEDKLLVVMTRTIYDALTGNQKTLVNKDDLDKLLAYEGKITELENQPDNEDIVAVQAFSLALNNLPTLDKIKLEDELLITMARTIYNALTSTQKALVNEVDLNKLLAYEKKINEIKDQDEEDDFYTPIIEFFELLDSLPKLENITIEDAEKIAETRAKYDSLSEEQKEIIAEEDFEKLKSYEEKIAKL